MTCSVGLLTTEWASLRLQYDIDRPLGNFYYPQVSSGLLVEAKMPDVDAGESKRILVGSAELLVSRTVPW